MKSPTPLKNLPSGSLFRAGDLFVLFGELFGRGYANGLVRQAREAGMEIVGITVGRRDADSTLRPLNAEELATAEADLGGRIINVPLMAGFDMDAPPGTPTPTEMVSRMTLDSWRSDRLDWPHLEQCRALGVQRFQAGVAQVMAELSKQVTSGRNIFFAHTMAGGIPRAKVFLAIANRVYKGRGERFLSSNALLESDLGRLILQNFDEVTANTFGHLIDGSAALRAQVEAGGGQVRYTAYGYHGTEILIQGQYQWQTYTNYTQGQAKMRLERIAREAWAKGVRATVFNCPEIRTNSSDIFVGVELPLFPLLQALKAEGGGTWVDAQWQHCQSLLQEGQSVEALLERIASFNASEVMQGFFNFEAWPMPNSAALAELMIGTSDEIVKMHKSRQALITDHLSSLVLEATGPLMFGEASQPNGPVLWLNHDVIARQLIALHG